MRVAVIGAGLAGLASACELADRGHEVTIFEKRPWAGGKTYSFVDPETGDAVDNGQHVFMACTTAYTDFLRRLGTLNLTRRQRRLRVPVLDADGRRSDLYASGLPASLHLAPSFAGFAHLTLREKAGVARVMAVAARMGTATRQTFSDISFAAWLGGFGQAESVIRRFWDFMIVPTLNCRSSEASAEGALFVLQAGFLHSSTSAAIGFPGVGLSELHVRPAIQYVESRGGSVRLGAEVRSLDARGGSVTSLDLASGERLAFDAFVCALPHTAVMPLLSSDPGGPELGSQLGALPTSPIINLHFWFDRPVAPFAFAAFMGCDLQWVFNRRRLDLAPASMGEHLVVSLSAADAYMGLDRVQLREHFLPQLVRALPEARGAGLVRYTAIKEPEATFIPAPGVSRPGAETNFTNLVLAGAYTNTGWPATMESAVRSGLTAARTLHAGAEGVRDSRPAAEISENAS